MGMNIQLKTGDDNAIFSIFRFFIGMDGKFIFLARRRNVAQSTALEEYLLKMGKLFEIRQVVAEIMRFEIRGKKDFSQKSPKDQSKFQWKSMDLWTKKSSQNIKLCLLFSKTILEHLKKVPCEVHSSTNTLITIGDR